MPDTCRIRSSIGCTRCGETLLLSARFQWGILPGELYDVGDTIRWLRLSDGPIAEPFTLFEVSSGSYKWNYGNPNSPQVVLFDEDIYTGNHELKCASCGWACAAIVAMIEKGTIESVAAWSADRVLALLGSSGGRANAVEVGEDGSYHPREEWFDATITYKGDLP